MLRSVLIGACLLVGSSASASPILVNGSFEIGIPPFNDHDVVIPAGSDAITGWEVTGEGVDLLEDPWSVSDGVRAIDLDARAPGGVQQTFATEMGREYLVSFDLSGNPEGGSLLKRLAVAVGGFSSQYAFDVTGMTLTTIQWQHVVFSFVATGPLETLVFTSLSPIDSSYGALIDDVKVSAVPEPLSLSLLTSGLGAALFRKGRRRRLHRACRLDY